MSELLFWFFIAVAVNLGILGAAYSWHELKRLEELDRELEASYFRMKWLLKREMIEK